jgi:hypothetical protein
VTRDDDDDDDDDNNNNNNNNNTPNILSFYTTWRCRMCSVGPGSNFDSAIYHPDEAFRFFPSSPVKFWNNALTTPLLIVFTIKFDHLKANGNYMYHLPQQCTSTVHFVFVGFV